MGDTEDVQKELPEPPVEAPEEIEEEPTLDIADFNMSLERLADCLEQEPDEFIAEYEENPVKWKKHAEALCRKPFRDLIKRNSFNDVMQDIDKREGEETFWQRGKRLAQFIEDFYNVAPLLDSKGFEMFLEKYGMKRSSEKRFNNAGENISSKAGNYLLQSEQYQQDLAELIRLLLCMLSIRFHFENATAERHAEIVKGINKLVEAKDKADGILYVEVDDETP